MSTKTQRSLFSDPRRVGDLLHVAAIIINVAYVAVVVYEFSHASTAGSSQDKLSLLEGSGSNATRRILDPAWIETGGFCIAHPESLSSNSHDVCLWVDTVMSALCLAMYMVLRNKPGMERISRLFVEGIPGVLAHGMGHASFAGIFRDRYLNNTGTDRFESSPRAYFGWGVLPPLNKDVIVGYIFWIALLAGIMTNSSWSSVIMVMLVVSYIQMDVPTKYGFTYVQTIVMLAYSYNELRRSRKEKDFAYASHPAIVGLPLLAIGWMESLACRAFVRDYLYGHVVYDAFIPTSSMIWYYVNYRRISGSNSKGVSVAEKSKEL
jgi:hypothetical protein